MSDKTINTFQERRQIDEAIAGLLNTSAELELTQRVRRIIQNHKPSLILPVLRKYLNTSSSQMRGGLGQLAAHLPQPETVALLRQEAGRRDNPTQVRLNAALILERFLQVEVSPGLMSDLKDPEVVVLQSLQEALEMGRTKRSRHILLEYVRQMRQENEDVAFLVLDLLGQQAALDQPDMLRLIAYDARPAVAEAALARLGTLREPAVALQAAEALHALQASLGPELAPMAARNLRKMRLAGIRWQPTPPDGWQALLSPCDLQGSQDLWFLHHGDGSNGTLIGMRINRMTGIVRTFGSELVERQSLPPKQQVGDLLSVPLEEGRPTLFLGVPYAYARACLGHALDVHWQVPQTGVATAHFEGKQGVALPEMFTLYNPALLRHDPGPVSPQITELLASGPDLWAQTGSDLAQICRRLLGRPAMVGWSLQESHVAKSDEQELTERLRRSLLAQAGWLHIFGDQSYARHAVCIAESLRHVPVGNHPLVLQMVAMGSRRSREGERSLE